uniref:Glycosyltransferase family 92 protein n=1 Tax=Caenorhabditis japonica TaxID=281687 RepID=A0A8R1DUU0_CAEJA
MQKFRRYLAYKVDPLFQYRRFCGSRSSASSDDWWSPALILAILNSIPGWGNVRGIFVDFSTTQLSLGDNAVALTMAVDGKNFDVKNATYNILGSNETHHAMWSAATSQTLIPFKMARYSSPSPVIICISPQFVAEQWQMFLMHVHTAHRFGGHLHVYITSIVRSYFDLMKEYERQGYMTMDFWLRMKFANSETPYFEPNGNIEWRNQASAETDCLLQYKEAAEYIAFFDMDDILFPKNHATYLEEFNAEWLIQPNASSLLYGRREHEFVKAETLSSFSFHELVTSLRSSKLVKRGKVVVKPTRYNSTWIHYSQHEDHSTRRRIDSPSLVHVQRPLQKHSSNNMTKLWRMEFGPLNETIREKDVLAIEEDFWRMRNQSIIQEIAKILPSTDFYLPIVFKCYYDAFYGPVMVEKTGLHHCPNADLCDLPQREDYKCVHSDAEYYSGPNTKPFTFHWSSRSRWSYDIGCYQ